MREQEKDYYLAMDPEIGLGDRVCRMFDEKDAQRQTLMDRQDELMNRYQSLKGEENREQASQVLHEVRKVLDGVEKIDAEKRNLFIEMIGFSPDASKQEINAVTMLDVAARKLTKKFLPKKSNEN